MAGFNSPTDNAQPVALVHPFADERNTGSPNNGYRVGLRGDWNISKVTGAASNVVSSVPAHIHAIRNATAGATAGTVTLKDGSTSLEVIASALAAGAQRDYYGGRCETGITIDLGNTADVVLVFWRPIA